MWMILVFLLGLAIFNSTRSASKKFFVFHMALLCRESYPLERHARRAVFYCSRAVHYCASVLQKNASSDFALLLAATPAAFVAGFYMLRLIPEAIPGRPETNAKIVGNRAAVLFFNPAGAAETRPQNWLRGANFIIWNPAEIGFGFYSVETTTEDERGGFLQKAAMPPTVSSCLEIGIYGGIGALAVFLIMLLKLLRGVKEKPECSDKLIPLEFIYLIFAPLTIFELFFADGFLFRYAWFALGLALGATWYRYNDSEGNGESGRRKEQRIDWPAV